MVADGNEVEGDDGGVPGQDGEVDENWEKEAELREQTGGPEVVYTLLGPRWCSRRSFGRSRRRREEGELGHGSESYREGGGEVRVEWEPGGGLL